MTGIHCHASFGDCMFNTALTRAVADRRGPVAVSTQPQYQDAYRNLPWVAEIVDTPQELLARGHSCLNFTPYEHFDSLKVKYGRAFSLLDTHRAIADGLGLGLGQFDQRPIFVPTGEELRRVQSYITGQSAPLVGVESVALSGQSWMDDRAVQQILEHHGGRCRFLWLSNQGAPDRPDVDNLLQFSRREVIALLGYLDCFYTTGSGFFCSSLACQPRKTVCLWKDDYYRYEARFASLGWDKSITWVHDHSQLTDSFRARPPAL